MTVPLSPGRLFLLLRYTLILATAYLLLVENGFAMPPVGVGVLVVSALASNLLLGRFLTPLSGSVHFGAAIILGDTLWITAALLQSGRFSADFFYLYFFVLLLAAIGENLALITLGAVVVCVAYLYALSVTGSDWSFWSSPSLIRIPFLFSAAAFYGYLVDQTRRERHKADEADRIKSEFLGTISHEMRTPLAVMLGYLNLLRDGAFGPLLAEQDDILKRVDTAGKRLHDFIGHLLDVSRIVNRIQSGKEGITCSRFDLQSLFEDLRSEFLPGPEKQLVWPEVGDLPPLETDREKVRTIVRNLVENALKYTPCGSVIVDARLSRDTNEVEIHVTDTGTGIALQELPHIFDAFRRAEHHVRDTTISGIGLGLYIVKQLVDLLDGEIQVNSTMGSGSSFCVRLARVHPNQPHVREERHPVPNRLANSRRSLLKQEPSAMATPRS